MKRNLLLTALLCMTALGTYAQRSYTFNAVALNVDGLPNEDISILGLTTVNLNKDGKNEAGATEFCSILANSGWDIVGFSEDFNFHSYLAAAPASTYYNFGKHSGSISTDISQAFSRAEIDGLGIAVAKQYSFTGDTETGLQEQWDEEYGGSGTTTVGDNGADNMITKGFRMYTVTLATGVAVDVYILHMDASTADSDDDYDDNGKDLNVVARESQLTQLATYIKENHNGRPVIILGDTNCRYTREQLKTLFIDVINADSRFTIEDAWVELMWGGTYPTYGGESMMTNTYGMQKGEIVDKVFYINTTESNLTLKANSYLHDESVTVSDHCPVVVNFTLTDPSGTAPTDAEKESSWTLEETEAAFTKPTWKGEQVVSGTTYYVMNVGTGEYIKWGGWWNAQAVAGYAGHPITPTLNGDKYELVTRASENRSIGAYEWPYMDNTENTTWTLTPVSGTSYQYYIEGGTGALTIVSDKSSGDYKALKTVTKDADDDTQKWIFVTEAGMVTAMADANPDYPFNFTPMLGAADFDVVDDWGGYAKEHWTNFESYCAEGYVQWGSGQSLYNSSAMIVSTTEAVTISQAISGLPTGNYKFSFEGFYNYLYTTTTTTEQRTRSSFFSSWGSWSTTGTSTVTSEQTMTATVALGSETFTLSPNRSVNVGDAGAASAAFRDGDGYMHTSYQEVSNGSLTISISKPETTEDSSSGPTTTSSSTTKQVRETYNYAYPNSVFFDNFRLEYRGTQTAAVDPYADYKKIVREKVNETYPKVMALNAAGQAAYDISTVVSRYNNDQITTAAIAQAMSDIVDNAYANAYAAHLAAIVQDAIDNMEANGGDLTGAILNPSFEEGDLTGWTVTSANDLKAASATDGTYSFSGSDGNYVFNAWSGDDGHTSYVQQTIKGVPNGLYELKAVLASFGTADEKTHDYHIYLTGNGYHTSVAATGGKTVGQEATLYFLVEDGSATIGAIGGNKGGGSTFIHYWPWEGCFFKADNFRLKYICDVPHGRLKLALDEANAAVLDAYGKAALDLSSYQTKYDNKSLTTDGTAEAAAVYTALQTAAKAQKTAGADMTWTIENPSFETGNYTGWTVTAIWDTGAFPQENGTYAIAGTDGRYMFNIWDAGNGNPITQTVTGIPNGDYKLTAMVATDADKSVTLTGNGASTTIAASTNGASSGVFPEVECTVSDGTLAITVEGADGVWYKCDDFHLTLLSPSVLVMNETDKVIAQINDTYSKVTVNRTIKPNTWSTFVVPFDIPTSMLDGWEIKELTKTEMKDNGDITLVFGDAADGIKAGVPYMVRNTTMTENLTSLSMENVLVNTTSMNNPTKGEVTFVGTYKSGYVPQGAFFISNNTFYQAADNTNTLKAFRAYFTVAAGTNARALKFRIDGEEGTTAIDELDSEVTVVGIYTLGGVRINEMQQGINILQMSDGSVVKVVIK